MTLSDRTASGVARMTSQDRSAHAEPKGFAWCLREAFTLTVLGGCFWLLVLWITPGASQ